MPFPDLTQLQLGELRVSKSGTKSAGLSLGGKPLDIVIGDGAPLRIVFDVKAYKDEATTRLNMMLSLNDASIANFFHTLENAIIDQLAARASHYFKKDVSKEGVELMWKSVVNQSDGYEPVLRTKVNVEPPRQLRVWNAEKEQIGLPA